MSCPMEVIDGSWVRAKLAERPGLQARLARATGIGQDKVSKIIANKRRVQPEEIPAILRFFEDLDRDLGTAPTAAPHGFSEPDVVAFQPASKHLVHELVRLLAPAASSITFYRTTKSMPSFGLLRDDTLIVALGAPPQPGDTVIVTTVDPDTAAAETTIARWLAPWLIWSDPQTPATILDPEGQSVAILGVVRSMVRAAILR